MINPEILNFTFFILKILVTILSLVFLFGIIYLFLKSNWAARRFFLDLAEFFSPNLGGQRKASKGWEKIKKRLEKNSESEAKLAIIEADDLLNETLNKMGYSGKTLGEKLTNLKKTILPNLDEVSEVHKTKSDILQDPSFRLDPEQAKRILEVYERALFSLEAL